MHLPYHSIHDVIRNKPVPRVLPFSENLFPKLAMNTTCHKVWRQLSQPVTKYEDKLSHTFRKWYVIVQKRKKKKKFDNFFLKCPMDFWQRPFDSPFNNALRHIQFTWLGTWEKWLPRQCVYNNWKDSHYSSWRHNKWVIVVAMIILTC